MTINLITEFARRYERVFRVSRRDAIIASFRFFDGLFKEVA